nr:RHS repeat-associated core domain-containing protein [Pseudomonas sp. 58(2021)]
MNAGVHHLTPKMSVIGPRGEAVREVDYLRTVAGKEVRALINRLQYDVAGSLVAQQDPRLPTPITTTVHTLDGLAVKTHNVDSGVNTVLPGPGGEFLQSWDANGNQREMSYDPRLRLRSVKENDVTDFETFNYLDASADQTRNLRGQMTALSDPSGTVQFNSFSMGGQSLEETRTFKDGKICTHRQRFSAVGALLQTTDAGGHVQQSTYDIAGQLIQVQLQLSGQNFQEILNGANYNAAGQITEQRLGNGVTSHWHYREADASLLRHYAQKASEPAVQDFEYEYDAAGNVIRIIDHTYKPTFFRNQRVDGERTFVYDSVNRLTQATGYSDAPPADNPGRPIPADPNDRLNYVDSFEYDDSNNLKKLTHVRDSNTYTREMFIDPASNRGVRWKPGDPAPDFGTQFDPAGNPRHLQASQPLDWNSRNQLRSLTLVEHAGGPSDRELYQYSQGKRVYKHHETHTRKVSHVDEVHYVGSLEVRTKSSGEELHRITVATGIGEVTCLHWVAGKPPGIDADQVCYSLTDHLGSNVTALDQQARIISQEGYYAYGGTAWMAARSQIEADYQFTRYSGKEMDVTGLYYYGARYYAPWLGRWVNADPAGDVDGLNRYAFVGNNPLRYFDNGGFNRTPAELKRTIIWQMQTLSAVEQNMAVLENQMFDLQQPGRWRKTLAKNVAFQIGSAAVGWFTSFYASSSAAEVLPNLSGDLIGLTFGNNIADASVGQYKELVNALKLDTPIVPRTSTLSREAIAAELSPAPILPSRDTYDLNTREGALQFSGDTIGKVVGAYVPGVGETMALGSTAQEANQAEEGLSSMKMGKILNVVDDMLSYVTQLEVSINANFAELGIEEFYDQDNSWQYLVDLGLGRVGTERAATIRHSDAVALGKKASSRVKSAKDFLKMYEEKLPAIRQRWFGGSN